MNDNNNSKKEYGEMSSDHMDVFLQSNQLIVEARSLSIPNDSSISMPLAELLTLGGGVSSLLLEFSNITRTTTGSTRGLYQLANQSVGDSLKAAKDGNFWGAFKKADGGSKMVKLKAVDPASMTDKMVMNANPATMLMAVALFSIEKELGNIKETQQEILAFLEIEKEAEIEADVITLTDIITKYKHNWDNARYVASNHKLICDIQRTARKNVIFFQKQVADMVKDRTFFVAGSKVNNTLKTMQKQFMYYKLSLFTFSLSSLLEIMLSGNFRESNINVAINEINVSSDEYRSLFSKCSIYLEKLSNGSIETNVLKGIGSASNVVGRFIGSIPKVKDGQVDEFLIEKGEKIKGSAHEMGQGIIESFAGVSNPNTRVIVNKLEDMDKIYNHVSDICFDEKNMYLIMN